MITGEEVLNALKNSNKILEESGLHPFTQTEKLLEEYVAQQENTSKLLKKTKTDLDTVRNNYFIFMQDTNAELIRAKKEHELLGLYQRKDRLNPYLDNWGNEFDDIVRQIKELEALLNE